MKSHVVSFKKKKVTKMSLKRQHCIKYARVRVSENPYSRTFYAVQVVPFVKLFHQKR